MEIHDSRPVDYRWHIMMNDDDAGGQAKLLTGMRELADKLLELFLFVCGQCGIISKTWLPVEDCVDFGLGSQPCHFEQLAITSGVYVDALCGVFESMVQQN